jgi:hypothetical protein
LILQNQLLAVKEIVVKDRSRGLAVLDEIFRAAAPPDPPLEGRYAGELLAIDLAPGLTHLAGWLAAAWMPWKGKAFDPSRQAGINIFSGDSLLPARLIWPLYRHYQADTPGRYRAFPFRTSLGPGLMDPGRLVLKIDYDLKINPAATVRRVLDELVQVSPGCYLGKAHLRWWWRRWQTVAFFSLST